MGVCVKRSTLAGTLEEPKEQNRQSLLYDGGLLSVHIHVPPRLNFKRGNASQSDF